MKSNLGNKILPGENLGMAGVGRRMKNIVSAADHAVMNDHYSFIPPEPTSKSPLTRDDNEDGCKGGQVSGDNNWQERMVSKYHEHLFKEFALADLSIPGRIGLRWRTRDEVMSGRGETSCGNKRCEYKDDKTDALVTLEVPFSYKEHGERKKELVKLRLCVNCRPLLQNSTTKGNSSMGSRNPKRESEQSEDSKIKKRELKNSDRKRKKEKRRRRST